MMFNPTNRTRKILATLLAAGVVGGTVAGATAASKTSPAPVPKVVNAGSNGPTAPVPKAVPAAAAKSTVPAPLTRAETAAEDVIGFLEKGQPAKSKSEARILRDLAHGEAGDALHRAGVPEAQIKAFQRRADHTARLSLSGAAAQQVSQAANSVSQLMPSFYARYHDPVPATVLRLDYLERQAQLDSQAGQPAKLGHTVSQLATTWQQLRPQLVTAGGAEVASSYDQHVTALKRGGTATAIQSQAVHGLDLVDQMEGVFLGK
jgi:hypothetical protein